MRLVWKCLRSLRTSSTQLYAAKVLPPLHVILTNKTTETYVEMFTTLRSALNGDTASIWYMLIEYELAAINAIHRVYASSNAIILSLGVTLQTNDALSPAHASQHALISSHQNVT